MNNRTIELKKEIYRDEIGNCLMCFDSPCSKACSKINLGRFMQSLWLDNEYGARNLLPPSNPCKSCKEQKCREFCLKNIDIPHLVERVYNKENIILEEKDYAALESDICGIKIENPFLLSSSVVSSNYDMCARALEAGWAGICYKTITTIDIHETSPRFSAVYENDVNISGFKNIEQLSQHSVEEDLDIFRKLKKNFPNKFLLVSIMGRNEKEWEYLARASQEAGADAIELNFSCPNMVEEKTGSAIGQDKEAVKRFTRAAKRGCTIPVIVKLTPNVAEIVDFSRAAFESNADGIAAINTIKSLIDIAPDDKHHAIGGYSGNAVKPIALRFIAEICKDEKTQKDKHISAMGGVETWRDALQFLILGARSIQITTAVMQYGYRIIDDLKTGLAIYLRANNTTLNNVIGSSLKNVVDVEEMKRDIKILPKFNREKCNGCLRCFVSCQDGGHQAIEFDEKTRKPIFNAKKCVGCHLCLLVCPQRAITSTDIEINC